MATAIYPGSFDPVTLGHVDVIERAAAIFEHVTVLVSVNLTKPHFFTITEREGYLRRAVCGIPNVTVTSHSGLLADYLRRSSASIIVKGIRAISDFEYEFQMAQVNKVLCETARTVFIPADEKYTFLSSSVVRQVGLLGGNIDTFVPNCVASDISAALLRRAVLTEG
ncbi:phosphopantetheine adenylyltransferase [Clostridia bacterium]|nr:phosphopantetheine adenylyltransferase [Clostridia bacterium]